MSNTRKHAPGPWTVSRDADLINHVSIDSPKHGMLAQVVWVMEDEARNGERSPQCEANAALIAAAPDLLDAIRAILLQVGQGKVLERDACITQARAAFARATQIEAKEQP